MSEVWSILGYDFELISCPLSEDTPREWTGEEWMTYSMIGTKMFYWDKSVSIILLTVLYLNVANSLLFPVFRWTLPRVHG